MPLSTSFSGANSAGATANGSTSPRRSREEIARLIYLYRSGLAIPVPTQTSIVYGHGSPIASVVASIDQVADDAQPVLVFGDSGVGKELVCLWIHERSRRQGRFVPVNAATLHGVDLTILRSELFGIAPHSALPNVPAAGRPGIFDAAHQGTLLLDELHTLRLPGQELLLRYIESGSGLPVGSDARERIWDVRLIAATNRDLRTEIAEGRFLSELYYRLRGLQVRIPPLRERPGDLPVLLSHFIQAAAPKQRVEICPQLLGAIFCHDWPGNVRDLKAFITSAVTCLLNQRQHQRHDPNSSLVLSLESLAGLAIASDLKEEIAAAATAYDKLFAQVELESADEKLITLLAALASELLPAALKSLEDGDLLTWGAKIFSAMAAFAQLFAAQITTDRIPAPGEDSVFNQMLAHFNDAERVIEILWRVLKRLKDANVQLSNRLEHPRYQTFEMFFGIKFDPLRKRKAQHQHGRARLSERATTQ